MMEHDKLNLTDDVHLRSLGAAVTALVVVLVAGSPAIRWLRQRWQERIVSDSAELNQRHAAKQGTPTMGGVITVFATLVATILWGDLTNRAVLPGILLCLVMTALGAYDDWIKARTKRPGLTARRKLILQLLTAIGFAGWIVVISPAKQSVSWHGLSGSTVMLLSAMATICWFAFLLTAVPNAVNLTDGLDGLAAGCIVLTAAVMTMAGTQRPPGSSFLLQDFRLGSEAAEFAILTASLCGAMLGFLWFNRHPARVFMGDTGALPAGALLGMSAVLSGTEWILAVAGGVFVVETLSVIVQVAWFKRTGRRVLLCSPLHNHFVFLGIPELRIVAGFWLVSLVLAATGFWMSSQQSASPHASVGRVTEQSAGATSHQDARESPRSEPD